MDNSTYLTIMSLIVVSSLITSFYHKDKATKTRYLIKKHNQKQYKLWLLVSIVYLVVVILKIVEITIQG